MNTVYASTYLYLYQCLSSVSCNFPSFRSFTFLVKFIPRYFILFKPIVNVIVFLVSFCGGSLLTYKNATNFWVFILYSATSLKSLISSGSFLWNL